MNYIKGHKYGIEERAKKVFGTTEVFELAGYLMPNGEMLNFSYSGYQREEDHRIIEQFFSKAQGTTALNKMLRRGNIRVLCSRDSYCFEFWRTPTKEQIYMLKLAEREANELGYYFCIEQSHPNGNITKAHWYSVLEYQQRKEVN